MKSNDHTNPNTCLLVVCAWLACGCAHGADSGQLAPAPADASAASTTIPAAVPADETPVTLDALLSPPAKAGSSVNGMRAKMIGDAGRTVGFRAGMASRARTLMKSLDARTPELDALYQFSTLVRPDGTIPPVIVEASDVASFSSDQFRVAGHVYRIEKEERFVSVPPTWRNYLLAGLSGKAQIELPSAESRPQGSSELLIWRQAVRAAWERGEKEADAVVGANFNRLTRDYTGMMLYSSLLATGMILPTRVTESAQAVIGDGHQLMLDDRLRRLASKARFEVHADKWVPVITSGPRTAMSKGGADATGANGASAPAAGRAAP